VGIEERERTEEREEEQVTEIKEEVEIEKEVEGGSRLKVRVRGEKGRASEKRDEEVSETVSNNRDFSVNEEE
jgi:hypothetical protein